MRKIGFICMQESLFRMDYSVLITEFEKGIYYPLSS